MFFARNVSYFSCSWQQQGMLKENIVTPCFGIREKKDFNKTTIKLRDWIIGPAQKRRWRLPYIYLECTFTLPSLQSCFLFRLAPKLRVEQLAVAEENCHANRTSLLEKSCSFYYYQSEEYSLCSINYYFVRQSQTVSWISFWKRPWNSNQRDQNSLASWCRAHFLYLAVCAGLEADLLWITTVNFFSFLRTLAT